MSCASRRSAATAPAEWAYSDRRTRRTAGFAPTGDVLLITRQGLDYFTELFGGEFPFAKLDQVFVPDTMGAMENVGCIICTESLLFRSKVTDTRYETRATVILHEMAHQWFGDLVTMKWWEDGPAGRTRCGWCSVASCSRTRRQDPSCPSGSTSS
jgi:hypothetical protein